MESQRIRTRLNELIDRGTEILNIINQTRNEIGHYRLLGNELQNVVQWRASCMNLLRVSVGTSSFFYTDFPHDYVSHNTRYIEMYVTAGVGLLTSLRDEIDAGLITDLETIISANLLESIREQAEVLLNANYKDASAVYCRVMLETSLKKICDKNSIRYRTRDTINPLAEALRTNEIINIIDWRQILSWADIGNAAAHGNFNLYSEDDVQRMIQGIDELINTHLHS